MKRITYKESRMTRRDALKWAVALAGLSYYGAGKAFANHKPTLFKIGACDWSIDQLARVEALKVGKQIGLDGVQVSLGTLADNMHLRQARVQELYKDAAQTHGVAIGGIAIGELNNIPYKSDPRAEQWVADSIDVARALDCRVVLLAFFAKGDLKNDKAGVEETIKRLKRIVPKAEDHGIILGIESWLSAREHMDIIDAVKSPNLKVYYDVANSHKMGYDIYEEIRWLGSEHICEFHAKENGYLLGKGPIDFLEFRKVLDDISYEGWVQIEGAVPEEAAMLESYVWNNSYLRSVLNS